MHRRFPDADNIASSRSIATLLLVVLATAGSIVVGVAVFDLEERVLGSQSPQVQFDFEYQNESGSLVVVHESGDTLDGGRVVFEDASGAVVGNWSNESEVTAGTTVVIRDVRRNETIRVIWRDEDGSKTIGRWAGSEYDPTATEPETTNESITAEPISIFRRPP